MAYCTQDDIVNAIESYILVELTDDDKDGSADSAVIARAIADADAVIDSFLRKIYDVPLATTPDVVRKLSVDLSLFNLFARRAAHFETPEWLNTKHKDAMAMLKGINRGEIDLGVEPPPAVSSAQVATTSYPTRLFTDTTLEDF